MKDSEYVMYLWNETEMRSKEKEARKKMKQNQKSGVDSEGKKGKEMMQNKKSDVDSDGKKGKDQHGFGEMTILDKEHQKNIKEEAAKPRATTNNIGDNVGITVSSEPKSVHESADEPAKEDVKTSGVESEGKKGKEMMQNKKSDLDGDGKKEKDQHGFPEKIVLDKEHQKNINGAAKPGATNVDDNVGIAASSEPKSVHESTDEPAKKDVATSFQQNDVVQSPSQAKEQKLANEDVIGTSYQQDDVAQDEQSATFLNLKQPQPVSSERILNRENPPPFGIGLSSTRGREPYVVSVEKQHGNQQPPERRNEYVIGNNENRSASTSNYNVSNVKEQEGRVDGSDSRKIPSFWTACPYCYVMHEYPLDYVDCTLKCQNCKRAFQAVKVAAPPIVDGKEAYFCCWGFKPLGFSVESYERSRNNVSSWSPSSPMFTCPSSGVNEGRNANNHAVGGQGNVSTFGNLHNGGGSKSRAGRKQSSPRMIYSDEDDDDNDGDDVLVDISGVHSGDA